MRTTALAGKYTDAESGLIYLRARYYDPGTAQFLTRDPAVAVTGAPYSYVDDNPLNGTDPSGLCFGPGCWLAKHFHGVTQTISNGAAGVLSGITLGHASGVLNALGQQGNYDLSSDAAKAGGFIGGALDVPFAVGAPAAFGYVSAASGLYNIAAACPGPGDSCFNAFLTKGIPFGLGIYAGAFGKWPAALIGLLFSEFQAEVNRNNPNTPLKLRLASAQC